MGVGVLHAPASADGRCARLVAAACQAPLDGEQAGGDVLQLVPSCGAPAVEGLVAVALQLARGSPRADELLGSQPAQQAQVLEWVTWVGSELASVSDDKLAKINDWLATRTFLAAGRLTLADLLVFGRLHAAVAALPEAQLDGARHLLRWCDLVQNVSGASSSGLFSAIRVALPQFLPPPPLPPAPAKTAAAGGAAAGGAAAGGAAAPATPQGGGKKDKAAAAAAAGSSSSSSSTTAAAAAAAPAAAAAGAAAAGAAAAAAGGAKQAKQKEPKAKKGGGDAAAAGGKAPKEAEEARIDMLDIRVGQIVAVQQHPNADSLYLEDIDLGEEKPRQVISGLVKFVPIDAMRGRRVVVVTNLKPAKMRDIMSYGMVLCASNASHDQVDPISPPEGAPVGERISFEGFSSSPLEEVNPKKKLLERLFPDLTTSSDGTPQYKGVPFMTSKGPVTSTIPNGHVA